MSLTVFSRNVDKERYNITVYYMESTGKWYVMRDFENKSEHDTETEANAAAERLADNIWNNCERRYSCPIKNSSPKNWKGVDIRKENTRDGPNRK